MASIVGVDGNFEFNISNLKDRVLYKARCLCCCLVVPFAKGSNRYRPIFIY
jgi:hypothetical protein